MRIRRRVHCVATWLSRIITVVGASLAAALVATWPLVHHLADAVPLGTERDRTVPLFDLWALWWTADRAIHGFVGYGDAPIFYPHRGVTHYSEPLPLLGLLVAPFWGLGASPALIYNLALLAALTLNGVFGYRLARALDLPILPALLGGVLMVTLPFAAKLQGVLPNLALFGMLWILEGMVRFGRDGRVRAAAWAAVGFAATYYAMQQYAFFFTSFAAVAGVVALGQQRFSRAALVRLVTGAVLAALLVLPAVAPALQVRREAGFRRSERTVQDLSAQPSDFLTRPETAAIALPPTATTDTGGLFPGLILLALAITGAASGIRDSTRRAWVAYLVSSAILALLLALGLNLALGSWHPFATLRTLVPGLDGVRSPYRFAVITHLCLPILAACALARLQWIGTTARNGAGVILLLGLLGAGENLAIPAPLAQVPASPRTAWTAWLRAQPTGTVIAHIPFPSGPYTWDYEVETRRMLAQIDHGKPMVNGYSSYFPQVQVPDGTVVPTYTRFQLAMAQQFPEYALACALSDRLGATMLVVDRGWLGLHESQMATLDTFLRSAYSDEQVQIYYLNIPPGQCQKR